VDNSTDPFRMIAEGKKTKIIDIQDEEIFFYLKSASSE
jgi:hypothetical protein